MIDRDRFDVQIHEAMAHLYDFPFLERSLVAERLGLRDVRGGGTSLHRLLVDAIERLKPPRDLAADAVAWKVYRYLHLRYVRSLSASAVAGELGLSTRQSQRVQSAAIASLSSILWETRRPDEPARSSQDLDVTSLEPMADNRDDPLLEDELAAVLAGDHGGELEAFPTILRGALETVAPMLIARKLTTELTIDQALDQRIAPHDLVRPALVQLFLGAVDLATVGSLVIRATAEDDGVRVELISESTTASTERSERPAELDRRIRVARGLLGRFDGDVEVHWGPQPHIVARLPLGLAPTVLVVEDNLEVIQLFRRYLSGSAFQMVSAANGLAALDIATTVRPAAITLDLLMPQRDGWELLQALKVHPATGQIPAIVCSVLRERELALALGAADFLEKPVSQHTFLSSLRQHALAPLRPPSRP